MHFVGSLSLKSGLNQMLIHAHHLQAYGPQSRSDNVAASLEMLGNIDSDNVM